MIFWYCEKRYKKCIKLFFKGIVNLEIGFIFGIVYYGFFGNKCIRGFCDYISLFENYFVKLIVEMY